MKAIGKRFINVPVSTLTKHYQQIQTGKINMSSQFSLKNLKMFSFSNINSVFNNTTNKNNSLFKTSFFNFHIKKTRSSIFKTQKKLFFGGGGGQKSKDYYSKFFFIQKSWESTKTPPTQTSKKLFSN